MDKKECCECGIAYSEEELFSLQVSGNAEEIDPDDAYDWYAITLGWALAKDMTAKQAHEFARHIRYHTDLG